MRIFSQNLGGEAKKWLKILTPNSINDLPSLYQTFINKWEIKKNPLQILSDYNNLKRNTRESVQDYCTRFNSVYNALPPNMKPPLSLALAKFPEGFDPNMGYQLRERDPLTLEDMQRGALSVEENLIEKSARLESEKRVTYKDETMALTSSPDAKIDNLVRVMERILEKINLNDRVPPRENQNNPQNINSCLLYTSPSPRDS